jgi:Na+-translocating ferredoxin:NAD+ oxidoreductase subunit G
MKALVSYVVVLASICGVSAGLLATIYEVTKEPIAASRRQMTLDAIQTVLPPFERVVDAVDVREALGAEGDALPEIYPAFSGDDFLGAAIKVTDPDGYGGDVTFMVGLTTDGRIYAIRLLSHKETPGLGTKLADERFAGQFRGLEVPEQGLAVRRDGGAIDAITGATISSRTATNAATEAARIFREYSPRLQQVLSQEAQEGGTIG